MTVGLAVPVKPQPGTLKPTDEHADAPSEGLNRKPQEPMLMQTVKDPVRAEWLELALKLGGLSDQDIIEWWESADVRGQGSPRTLWESGRFEEVERAAAGIPPGLPDPMTH
jgi:hypothetical protein